MSDQTLFDAIAAKEVGIRQADENADEGWKEAAYSAVLVFSETLSTFTADDVWDAIERDFPNASTHEPAALGPVFLRAARAGLIQKTGQLRMTRNSRRHRDLTVWARSGQ